MLTLAIRAAAWAVPSALPTVPTPPVAPPPAAASVRGEAVRRERRTRYRPPPLPGSRAHTGLECAADGRRSLSATVVHTAHHASGRPPTSRAARAAAALPAALFAYAALTETISACFASCTRDGAMVTR